MRLVRWFAGFFEVHAPQSMSRLLALLCTLAAVGVVAATAWYLLHATRPSATVIAAMLGALGTLIVGGAVALVKRSPADPPKPTGAS